VPLSTQLTLAGLPDAQTEYRFHPVRKWRFDYAWPHHKLALEIDGGGFVAGRHSRGLGIEKDCEKVNEAIALGWRVMRATPRQVRDGIVLNWIERALGTEGSNR